MYVYLKKKRKGYSYLIEANLELNTGYQSNAITGIIYDCTNLDDRE